MFFGHVGWAALGPFLPELLQRFHRSFALPFGNALRIAIFCSRRSPRKDFFLAALLLFFISTLSTATRNILQLTQC